MTEFEKFAIKHQRISSLSLHRYQSLYQGAQSSITPYIIEERQLNVAQMDVFSRLMMDRILFLGVPVYERSPISYRLSCYSSIPPIPGKTSDVYQFSRWSGIRRTRHLRYHAVNPVRCGHYLYGAAASMSAVLLAAGQSKKTFCPSACPCDDPSAGGRS